MVEQSGDMSAAFAGALESSSVETSPVSNTVDTTPAATEAQAPIDAATTQPVATESDQPKGEPPQWRWQDILETQRKKAAEEAEQRVRQEYAWAQELAEHREIAPQAIKLATWLDRDPAGALAWLQQQVQPPAPANDLTQEPQPDQFLQMEDGRVVPVYSAERLAQRERWFEQKLAQKLSPVDELIRERQQTQQYQQQLVQTQTWAVDVIAPLRQLPYFDEFKSELGALVQSFDPRLSQTQMADQLRTKYTELFTQKVTATQTAAEANALESLRTRAVAGAVNPAAGQPTGRPTFKSGERGFQEALEHYSGASR